MREKVERQRDEEKERAGLAIDMTVSEVTQDHILLLVLERVEHFLIFYLIRIHICIATITQPCENCIYLTKAKNLILAMWLTEKFSTGMKSTSHLNT